MLVKPIKTDIIKEKFDLLSFLDHYFHNEDLQSGDVVVISSKIIAIAQNRMKAINSIIPSETAYSLANEYQIEPALAEVILDEADIVLGGVPRVITSLKNGILSAYAGVDRSNVPEGFLVLWPKDPAGTAQLIHQHFKKNRNIHLGIIISDSQVVPLRAGTYGVAIGIAGFKGMISEVGFEDLFGKEMVVTRWNIADNLASAANLVMGETTQCYPLALIHKAPIELSDEPAPHLTSMLSMEPSECMIFGCLKSWENNINDA